jgi:hypothetical protein
MCAKCIGLRPCPPPRSAPAGPGVNASGKPVLLKEFEIYRWDPDRGDKPKYHKYAVDINK